MRNKKVLSAKQERGVTLFRQRGYRVVKVRSLKYVALEQDGTGHRVYIGRHGAIRAGWTISDSISIGRIV